MTYPLERLLPQLENGTTTAGNDCAVETALNLTRSLSHGKVWGNLTPTQQAYAVHAVRNWAHEMHNGLLFKEQTLPIYQHPGYEHLFHAAGLQAPHVEYFSGVGPERLGWGHTIRRLKAGWIAHFPIDYGVYRHTVGADKVGSLTFSDGHSIVVANPRKQGRHHWLYVDVGDSLCDGRIRWVNGGIHQYPSGWQTVRLLDIRAAAGAWGRNPAGAGHDYAIFLKPRS